MNRRDPPCSMVKSREDGRTNQDDKPTVPLNLEAARFPLPSLFIAMTETRIIAKAIPKPGHEQKVKELLSAMIAPTMAEPGAVTYDLHVNEAGNRFYFFEIYESREAFDAHVASPHFKQLQADLPPLLSEPLEVEVLTQVQ